MGKKSRDKGARGELEFAKLVGGLKMPMSGAAEGFPNDVLLPNGMKVEVKRRASMEKTLYSWILDEREKPDLVAFRADHQPWIVAMTLEKFQHFLAMEAAFNARRPGAKTDQESCGN